MLKDWEVLYNQYEVSRAIRKMADRIQHLSPSQRVVVIAILKGGCWTAYNLVDELSSVEDLRIGHLGISSYGTGRKPDQMKITSTLDLSPEDIQGADTWLVDDIYDTGGTMHKAQEVVRRMLPSSLRTATLVWRVPSVDSDGPSICGFEYHGNRFLAGCGMGCGELYRHYNEIYMVPPTGE